MDLDVHSESDPELNCFNRIFPAIDANNNSLYYDSNSLNNFTSKTMNDFSMIHINIRSITNKLDELLAMISLFPFDFDAFCFSEVWLDDNSKDLISIPGYLGFHSLRPVGKRGGGVSIFVRNEYKTNIIKNLSVNNERIETLFLELKLGNNLIYLGNVYKPPHISDIIFNEVFPSLLCDLRRKNSPIFLSGDFNVDLLDPNSAYFRSIMDTYLLIPTIHRPTRITDTSMTLIDNIFVSGSLSCSSGIFCSEISDHLPIFLICKNLFSHPKTKSNNFVNYRLINDSTLETMSRKIELVNFEYSSNNCDVSEMFQDFYDKVYSAYTFSCPIRKKFIVNKHIKKPWISQELLVLIKKDSLISFCINKDE